MVTAAGGQPATLAALVTREKLQQLAGERSFTRGEVYAIEGRVEISAASAARVEARISGTDRYRARLVATARGLDGACDCPFAQAGKFCKHLVATGLAWLGEPRPVAGVRPGKRNGELREAIDQAFAFEGMAAVPRAQLVACIRDELSGMMKRGAAGEARELTEYAIEVAGRVPRDASRDDYREYRRLLDLHITFCRAEPANKVKLAARLFDWGRYEYGLGPRLLFDRYRRVLGKEGRAEFGRLAAAEYERLDKMSPGSKPGTYKYRLRHLRSFLSDLARAAGDIDEAVRIEARDLSSGYRYLIIAELLRQAGRPDEALRWAEQGLQQDPEERLCKWLAKEYRRRRRPADVVAVAWRIYDHAPRLDHYRELKRAAGRLQAWPEWREKALARLRWKTNRGSHFIIAWGSKDENSRLVEILLWEKDEDGAWQAAQEHGCRDEQWLELARRRRKEHPADAIPIFQRLIEAAIRRQNNAADEQAVQLLREVGELFNRAGRAADFDRYIETLRAEPEPKRNVIAILERLKK